MFPVERNAVCSNIKTLNFMLFYLCGTRLILKVCYNQSYSFS